MPAAAPVLLLQPVAPALSPVGPRGDNRRPASEKDGLLKRLASGPPLAFAAATAIDDDIVADIAHGARIPLGEIFFAAEPAITAKSAIPQNCGGDNERGHDVRQSITHGDYPCHSRNFLLQTPL